jgi:hypothetical protein
MRISEFCNIKRECIFPSNGSYFIILPRNKQPASHRRVQVVDTLEVTKDIYYLIYNYIQVTNPYGKSETLISYKSLISNDIESGAFRVTKKDKNNFHKDIFRQLLKRFYNEIVYGVYKKSVERKVRPNDTRHFAFCSLMMQGISPLEIARLGGHSSIESQYHYSNHTEYFIDVEVDKLTNALKNVDGTIRGTTFENGEISFADIEKRSYTFPQNDVRLPMQVGFCTDEMQGCVSEECMLCPHWWIHPNKLVEIKPIIEKKIFERRQKIIEIGDFLKKLNESFTATKEADVHPNVFTKMKTDGASIQEHLEQIARLEMLKGYDEE